MISQRRTIGRRAYNAAMGKVRPVRTWFVAATLLLGMCAMVGVLLPWAHGLQPARNGLVRSSLYGFEYKVGVAALAGGLGLTLVSVLYLLRRIRDAHYVTTATVLALASFAAAADFWISEVNTRDPINAFADFFRPVRISAGWGWNLTMASSAAALLCRAAFAVAWSGTRLVHDERPLDAGSLIPNRFRVRIVRRAHTAP